MKSEIEEINRRFNEQLELQTKTRAYLNSSNNPADVKLALVDAANVIQKFNNPKLPEKKTIKKTTGVPNYKKGRGI